MKGSKSNSNVTTVEDETKIYSMVKDYINNKTNIPLSNIDVDVAVKKRDDGNTYWDNFSIQFRDLSTNTLHCLECGKLL